MLTNTGKNIMAKYLLGQTNGYASHIAIGCGPKPLGPSAQLGDYSQKASLDFEMLRVPITSRGYVVENVINADGQIAVDGQGNPIKKSEIVLTAQLPTTERYEITEIGLYPALSNPSTNNNGSRTISTFNNSEAWQYHSSGGEILAITSYTDSIDKVNGVIPPGGVAGEINVPGAAFFANSDNSVLDSTLKVSRNERPRFLNSSLFLKGDLSNITGSGSAITPASASTGHVHLPVASLNLNRNSGQDILTIAFALVNKEVNLDNPTDVKLIVEFASNDNSDQYARFNFALNSVTDNFNTNRYFVKSLALQDAVKSTSFSWESVTTIKIYAEVEDGGTTTGDYYIALDGMRIENITAQNPLYGLVGYTVLKTSDGRPIVKAERTNNLIEFRFAVDVA